MSDWRVELEVPLRPFQLKVNLEGDKRPLAIIGPNGSGKTTLLRAIAGAIRPQRGFIRLEGRVLFDHAGGVDLAPEERGVGYVPQGLGLFPHLSVLDNVAFGLSTGARRLPLAQRQEQALRLLDDLDCGRLASRRLRELSGGEQQRVALARALLVQPHLLLLDEPLSALDVSIRRQVRTFLAQQLQSLSRPALVVTHDVRDVAALDARVVVLDEGRVVREGTLAELRSRPNSDFVEEFVDLGGGEN